MDTSNLVVDDNTDKQVELKKQIKSTCRQFAALLPGYLLMIVGGLHVGWGIFNPKLKIERAARTETDIRDELFFFFLGVASGGTCAHRWFRYRSKALTYCVAAIFSIVSGIMLTMPLEKSSTFQLARVFAGIAFGQAYYALIMQCIILKTHCRGFLLSFCHFFTFFGIYTGVIIVHIGQDVFSYGSDNKIRNIGVTACVLSVVSLICTFKILQELPTDLLYEGDYDGIMARLLQLRKQTNVTPEIETEFNELKLIVEEDGTLNFFSISEGNFKPLLILIIVTTVSLLSFNYPLNIIRLNALAQFENKLFIFVGILIIIRIVFGIYVCNLCDSLGRRKIQLISGSASGVILLVHGLIASVNMISTATIIIFIAYEISITLGVNSVKSVLMFEAFPLTKRSGSITTIIIFEYIIQSLLVLAVFYYPITPIMDEYILFGFGSLMIVLSVILWFMLPETKGLTMRQARDIFRS